MKHNNISNKYNNNYIPRIIFSFIYKEISVIQRIPVKLRPYIYFVKHLN